MAGSYFQEARISADVMSPSTAASPSRSVFSKGSSALSSRISTVLSASYADLDIRDALETLDERRVSNNQETRRQLRLDIQREVVECNGEIVQDFGQVAEVCCEWLYCGIRLPERLATQTYWRSHYKLELLLLCYACSNLCC